MLHREISDKKYQMDSLDGLRGLAALIVVFSHTSNSGMYMLPFLDLKGIGKAGVYLFFLLSAFLLTLPLLQKRGHIFTLPVMSHYWQRRFFRIYPLFLLYLLLALISTWLCSGVYGEGVPFSLDLIGFFKHLTLQEGKGVTWSIAVEFKFYFMLPVLVAILAYLRPFGFWLPVLLFAVLLVLSQVISPQGESLPNDARLLPYMPIFLIGMFLAVLQDYMYKGALNNTFLGILKYLGYLGVVGVVVMTPLVFSLLKESVERDYFHKQFILYAIFWAFILISSVNVKGVVQKFLTLPLLRFYGALSFSLYLFHPIFISAVKKMGIGGGMGFWIVLLGATAAAYISFSLFERPLSKFKFN